MLDRNTTRSLGRLLGGAVIGAPIGYAIVRLGVVDEVQTWRPEEIVSTVLAAALLMVAAIVGLAATHIASFRVLAERGEGHEPIDADTLPTVRRQAVLIALSALVLLIPPIGAHAGWKGSAALIAAAALGVLLLALSWVNLRVNRDSDELSRAVITQSNSASFWVLYLALLIWAALAKLGLAGEVNSWTLLTIVMGVSLAISTVVSIRRGLVPS